MNMVTRLIKYWRILIIGFAIAVLLTSFWGMPINASAQGSVYYVAPPASGGNDSNPGTEAQPWATIQKAANTLTAGDTVYIKAGTYQEQVIPQNSGSVGNTITYAAYPGHTVTIDGTGMILPSYETGLFVVEDRSYIKVSGLRIINAGPNDNNAGIYVDNSHYVIVENNYTYNTVSSGIGVWDGSNIIIDGNEVRLACNDGEQEDITISGTDIFEVKNNHVHDGGPGTNGGEGITIKGGATNGKVYKNHVHDITSGQRTCLYVDGWGGTIATSNIEVYQNVLHNCGAGISLSSEDGSLVRDVKVYNNIVYGNQSNGLEIGNWGEPGISVRPVQNVTFINNTVYNNGTTGWGGGFFNENPNATNIAIRNNIFSQNVLFQIANESTVPLTVDHNLIDSYREYADEIRGTDYVEGEPLFVNAAGADFHLRETSPAIDNGSSVDVPTDDYEGNSRPQDGDEDGTTAYDIGAYEVSFYVQAPAAEELAAEEPKTEEPETEQAATEEPSVEVSLPVLPVGPVVDDFEGTYEPDQGWEVWIDDQTDTSLAFTLDNEIAHGGSASLRLEFDIAPEGSVDISHSFNPVQDWSNGTGLSIWLHFSEATEGNQGIGVTLFAGDPEVATPFEVWLEISPENTDSSGWILTELPWDRFSRAEWADEGGLAEFDPSRVASLGLTFGAPDDSRFESTVWVDDIRLLGEAPQPIPTETAVVTESTPPPTPVAPAEEGGESGGGCPISLGLILAGLALVRRGARRPE